MLTLRFIVVSVLVLFLAVASALADQTLVYQGTDQREQRSTGLQGANGPLSLFDASRFQMRHSYSVSYFSGGGQGEMVAMYLNQMDYDLTSTLRLSVRLGWLHQPQTALGLSEQTISNQLIPAFQLDWRPSDKFQLRINYERLSPYAYPGNRARLVDPYYGDWVGSAADRREDQE